MATRTIRVWWKSVATGWLNFNWDPITSQSVVHISACEWKPSTTIGGKSKHRGAAPIFVKNIRPHGSNVEANGVEFFAQVEWGTPLDVVFDITVLDKPEQEHTV
ncbi:hypothetical protein IYX23_09190 [Methylocystis sp. L43]|jgi:hypothetical protein|uniref:hypothetical protein n=1 Tax=unclassified Methylocystis TaxID=2625913 RepID=UPI0018C28BFE|nr:MULTISPECIES: hypothetical protein [unclassified Methylocystis]MBG0797844.1 hypothetical protein [Methylocystis sp. L43]MBG0806078.1 hypothetical protein [Methylocystis sp. H15]